VKRREFITLVGGLRRGRCCAGAATETTNALDFFAQPHHQNMKLAAFLRALAERDYIQGRICLVTQWAMETSSDCRSLR